MNIHTQRWGWCVRCRLAEGRRSTFQTTGRRVRRSRSWTETRYCEITCQRHHATSNEVSRLFIYHTYLMLGKKVQQALNMSRRQSTGLCQPSTGI